MADDPAYLTVGTEVSAKYKGAFCEAKIRKIVRVVKCKVTFKAGNGSSMLTDDQIRGTLRIGANVEAKHPDKNQFLEATINKIQDCSQYTVVFDDGDITTLRRSALCLKSGRHFNESETLDQLPLTHPEHFSNPVVGGRRGVRRRAPNNDADKGESSDEEEEAETPTKRGEGRNVRANKYDKELDMGKVVCVESTDKKKSKDTWFPALVVSPSAQETAKIHIKDEYLVRSFRDGRYYTVPKKEITEFTKESSSKYDSNSNMLRTAVDKALQYLEKNELPPHWDREVLFGNVRQSVSGGEEQQSESEVSEDDPREEKDRFIAQLYKFMDDRSTPLNKVPQVCGKDLDLHKLFKVVTSKGGYTKVTNQSQWKAITIKMGCGNMPSTSTINLVKQAYKKFLFNFEEFYRKLGCTWTPRSSVTTSNKSRSSRSLFRDRMTPSSSRESVRDSKTTKEDDDGQSSTSSRKERKEKEMSVEKERVSEPSPEAESPAPDTGTGSESEQAPKKPEVEEPRRSRGRKSKKELEEAAAASPSSSAASSSSKKKRQPNASKERDSSVASSTKDEGSAPPTPSSSKESAAAVTKDSATTAKKPGVGRGKYKRTSGKAEVEVEKEVKVEEEKPRVLTPEPPPPVVSKLEIRLGDKLEVYYPKSEGKTYEAKVIDINEKTEKFLVHYTGWNNRYDEWIDRARVSENVTLKVETSGEEKPSSQPTAIQPVKGGSVKRKGRNSSSATSTSSNTTPTTTTTTTSASSQPPSTTGTRSKSAAAAGKRKRSTSSSEVAPGPVASTPKRRRTRQRSGQETAPAVQSDSEPETSDSDGKSNKSEKTTGGASVGSSQSRRETQSPDSVASMSSSVKETKVSPRIVDSSDKKPEPDDLDDQASSSSAISSKSSKSMKSKEIVTSITTPSVSTVTTKSTEETKEQSSSSSTGSGNQVIDLNQIRSEMKGLDKMVKSSTSQSASSPAATPPLAGVVGSSPADPTKLDIYEFQDDFSDDTATASAPKLKMFSPRSPDKGPNTPPVAASSTPLLTSTEIKKEDVPPPEKPEKSKLETSAESKILIPAVEAVKEAAKTKSRPATPTPLPKGMSPVVQLTPVSFIPPHPSVITLQTSTSPSVVVTSSPPIVAITTSAGAMASFTSSLVTLSTQIIPRCKSPATTTPRATMTVTSALPLQQVSSRPPLPTLVSPQFQPPPALQVAVSVGGGTGAAGESSMTRVSSVTTIPISTFTTIAGSPGITSPPVPVLVQRPSQQPPPVMAPLRPVITLPATTLSLSTSERPPVLQTTVPPGGVTTTVLNPNHPDAKLLPFVTRKHELFPHLVAPDSSPPTAQPVPTISIISKDDSPQQSSQPPPPLQIPQMIIAATIPPPPPPVVLQKTPLKPPHLATSADSSAPPQVKQKKKKVKTSGITPPLKNLAPLPSGGAPPPPPVVVIPSVATTQQQSIGGPLIALSTPTPGRKTPVKKRIPPPMDSPGKPMKSATTPLAKPGKMNSEAMNAAIATVGASPPVAPPSMSTVPPPPIPPPLAVPTTVITPTANLFTTHASSTPVGGGGVIFATPSASQQQQQQQLLGGIVPKPGQPVMIKSSAESIAASIAAVAAMGSASKSSMAPTLDKKPPGMPMKRFMKESGGGLGGDKMLMKDKLFPMSTPTGPPQPSSSQQHTHHSPQIHPQIVIGKPLDSSSSPGSTQPPITIQAKFQPSGPVAAHSIAGSPISGPAVTFVKTSGGHHHLLDQSQVQSNLSKHPVIIIPAAPVVIKPVPFQHHQSGPPQPVQHGLPPAGQHSSLHPHQGHSTATTIQPVIVSKPVPIESTPLQTQPSVLMTATPGGGGGVVKSTLLPITVTPSVAPSPVTMEPVPSMLSAGKLLSATASADLPPTITVTKATTVMKSVSPDIIAVSSYSSSSSNISSKNASIAPFTQPVVVKHEPLPAIQLTRLDERKEPEIVLKPAPASAQIVFQTEKKPDLSSMPAVVVKSVPIMAAAPVEEESCNSLLCEEIIPGSPTTGEESEKLEEDTDIIRKELVTSPEHPASSSNLRASSPMMGGGNKPVIVVGPKYEVDDDDDDGFMIGLMRDRDRRSKYDDDEDKLDDDHSVDSPMGPPSEGRADLPFRDSFSDAGDHSGPSSPSTTSTISTDDSSRRHRTSRLSPTPEGGSSKSKDSEDDEDIDSDVGSKIDSKHGSTRGSTRIRNQSSRHHGRSPSPPLNKRRRMLRRKSPAVEELARYTQRIRTSSGRKIIPTAPMEAYKEAKALPPPPPVNLAKPPKTGRFNFIPNLTGEHDPDVRIGLITQAINDLKEQHHKTKTESAIFERRFKRWKRRAREKERVARQEATRAAS